MFKRKININSRSNIYDTYYDMKLMYSNSPGFLCWKTDYVFIASINRAGTNAGIPISVSSLKGNFCASIIKRCLIF